MALTQFGTDKITVIVRKETSGMAESKPRDEENVVDSSEATGAGDSNSGIRRKSSFRRAVAMNAIQLVRHAATVTASMYTQNIGRLSGDKALQDMAGRQMEIVTDAVGAGQSVIQGAIGGMWFGPVGVVVGAAFGAANATLNLTQKYANRERDYNLEVLKQESQINYARNRASINMAYGRLR